MTGEDRPVIRTHQAIDRSLCGEPTELGPGRAVVTLTTRREMGADAPGLVHGGFVFGLADHAAMLAVNEPTVVLVSADTRFRRPVRVGEVLRAEAEVTESQGHRHRVAVAVLREAELVFDGLFDCAVPRRHVLEDAR
jgi:uncharacterized protein (TIGR00369 family)